MSRTVYAPAKINLTLEILGRRADGYHSVRSVMQAISICDVIQVEAVPSEGIVLLGGSPEAPADESNLVYRAAKALGAAAGGGHGARIALSKRIPVGAGLGGGSSDAAAALRALNDLWETGQGKEPLMRLGAALGSDVPFFLTGGTALAEGRGEILTPLPAPAPLWFAVVWPFDHLGTVDVYRAYAERGARTSESDRSGRMVQALASGSPADVADALYNDLEAPAFALSPSARLARDLLVSEGALGAVLTGSGSAVYGVASGEDHARRLASAAAAPGWWAAACHTVNLPMEDAL